MRLLCALLMTTLLVVLLVVAAPAEATTVVSTSGVPHQDHNLDTEAKVAAITQGADVVVHSGDQVLGRWNLDAGTWRKRRDHIVERAAAVYPEVQRAWDEAGVDVLWGIGDHEVGDLNRDHIPRNWWKSRMHAVYVNQWKKYHDNSPTTIRDYGDIKVAVVRPIHRWDRGLVVRWASRQIAQVTEAAQADPSVPFVVASEIPALQCAKAQSSSELSLQNGDRVMRELASAGVDLYLGAECHDFSTEQVGDTTQIVHGSHQDQVVEWLVIEPQGSRVRWEQRRLVDGETVSLETGVSR